MPHTPEPYRLTCTRPFRHSRGAVGAAAIITLAAAAHAQPIDGTPPLDWKTLEAPHLTRHLQLTSRSQFVKAGEAYFSPDNQWIIFQATAVPESGAEPDPFYAMYAAKLLRDPQGHVTGLDQITRVSPPHSANTCGWFHPTDSTRILFGSTVTRPANESKSGFQVGSRRYVWMFPDEMEVVTSTPFSAGRASVAFTEPRTVFTLPNYDAECSYSPDGRFVLYAHIEDRIENAKPDANIYVFDTKTAKHHPIVNAPGYDGGPFFSPDGRSICYRSDREGNDLLQLFVADLRFEPGADGAPVPVGVGKEYQLTRNEHVNWCPFWHPSGEFMVYATSEISHRNYEVFAIETDMAKLRAGETPAAMRHARVTQADGADVLPVFSSDGKLMMWTTQRGPKADGEERASSQLWIAEWSGSPFMEAK